MSLAIPGNDIQFLAITFNTASSSVPTPSLPSFVGEVPPPSVAAAALPPFLPLFNLPRM